MGTSDKASSHGTGTSVSEGSEALSVDKSLRVSKSVVKSAASVKKTRLVNWNVEILHRLLNAIVTRREATTWKASGLNEVLLDKKMRSGKMVVDEVEEVITLPNYDAAATQGDSTTISQICLEQLREFVTEIAGSYRDNPFHNVSHCLLLLCVLMKSQDPLYLTIISLHPIV